MTLKILVVEDEPIEREALTLFLDNSPFDVEVRTAADARQFLEACAPEKSWQPQIVLLDLRIPGGGGLGALEQLRMHGFTAKVLVLTAYDVFEYAQKAMELGVATFLVKPVVPDRLYCAIRTAINQIDEQEEGRTKNIKTFIRDNRRLLMRALFADLAMDGPVCVSRDQMTEELELPPHAPCSLTGIIALDGCCEDRAKQSIPVQFLSALTSEMGEPLTVLPWNHTSTLIVAPLTYRREDISASAMSIMAAHGVQGNVVSIGTAHTHEELQRAIKSMEDMLEESLLGGTGRMIAQDMGHTPPEAHTPQDDCRWRNVRERIIDGYRRGNLDEMVAGRNEMVQMMESTSIDVELSKMILMGLFGEICEMLIDLRCDMDSVRAWSRRQMLSILAPNNPAGLRPILVRGLETSWTIRESSQDERALIISQAMEYIRKHFDEVTLESAARHVHVSSSHLSRVFSKILRRRFVDVVKEVRMERAKCLLCEGNSVRDTALKVGYGNIAYFSTLFKHTCGVSPSEYSKKSG